MTQRERLVTAILALGKMLSDIPGILKLPTDKQLEIVAECLMKIGVILPPVAVWQTVYVISDYTHETLERSIVKVIVAEDHYDFIFDTQSCWRDTEIGKTVFLTREEAEAELEKRRKEGNTT